MAPAVLMPTPNHHATFGVFNTWRAQKRAEMGGTFDWSRITEAEMRELSERMFDAAGTPLDVRAVYWRRYDAMISQLNN